MLKLKRLMAKKNLTGFENLSGLNSNYLKGLRAKKLSPNGVCNPVRNVLPFY